MNLRVQLSGFCDDQDLVVIVKCPDGGVQSGKYIVGRHATMHRILAVVMDARFSFHPALAKAYRLHPFGGGRFAIDQEAACIHIFGISEALGAEPERELTRKALAAALPNFTILVN
jgi:hypothetical protein